MNEYEKVLVNFDDKLTQEDKEIINLLSKGMTTKKIGEELNANRKSINNRISQMRARGVDIPYKYNMRGNASNVIEKTIPTPEVKSPKIVFNKIEEKKEKEKSYTLTTNKLVTNDLDLIKSLMKGE